uniref:Uncharacterized protein n=1 Tax=Malus domestica TaxID=3750 RepID=G0XZC4_MALDO|nr:hypothetical protein [Malus domestica]
MVKSRNVQREGIRELWKLQGSLNSTHAKQEARRADITITGNKVLINSQLQHKGFRCSHTFREGNVVVDKLANLEILSSSFVWHATPSIEILPFLHSDFLGMPAYRNRLIDFQKKNLFHVSPVQSSSRRTTKNKTIYHIIVQKKGNHLHRNKARIKLLSWIKVIPMSLGGNWSFPAGFASFLAFVMPCVAVFGGIRGGKRVGFDEGLDSDIKFVENGSRMKRVDLEKKAETEVDNAMEMDVGTSG